MARRIRAILIDLSGTLHIDDTVVPGAVEALKKLRRPDLTVKFVTNTTKESKRFLHDRLTRLGFELVADEIHSSLGAARALLVQRQLRPMLLLSPEAIEDFEGLECTDRPDSVVIGLAPDQFHYDRLNAAFRCLLDGAKLIGIHAGRYYRRPDGLALGPGAFVKGLEYAAGCKAELVGKPNEAFFLSALVGSDVQPEESIMIGDDVVDDIEGALKCGMKAFLVRTGKYRDGDEDKIAIKPTAVVPSFVEAVDKIVEEIDGAK